MQGAGYGREQGLICAAGSHSCRGAGGTVTTRHWPLSLNLGCCSQIPLMGRQLPSHQKMNSTCSGLDGYIYGAGAKSHPKFFQDPPGQMHLAGPVPSPTSAPLPTRRVLLWVAVSRTRYQASAPLIQDWRLEGPFLTSPYRSWDLGLPCRPLGRSMVFTSSSAISKAFRPLSFFSQKSYRRTDRCEANKTARHLHAQVNHSSPMMAKAHSHVARWLVSA